MAVSIEDVAQRANVSISTVSRVINGRKVVNAATRERVEQAIRELDYRPNIFARGLMLRRSNILGLVLPDLHGEFYSEIIRGANEKARELNYHLLVTSVTKDDDGQEVLAKVGNHGLVDGVAVMVSELDARSRKTLAQIDVPFVVLDGHVTEVQHDTVRFDQAQGTREMVQHLLDSAGVERIIFLGGREKNYDTIERLATCREILNERGINLTSKDVYHLDYDYMTAFGVAERDLQSWIGPKNAVFAANDEMAAGVIHAALSHRVAVPEQLRVVGFDDTRIARMIRPRLTTVHVPMATMGSQGVELLYGRLNDPNREGACVTLQAELVVRESCGANPL